MGREKIENPFPSDFEGNSSGIEPSAALRNAIHFPTRSRKRSENDGISSLVHQSPRPRGDLRKLLTLKDSSPLHPTFAREAVFWPAITNAHYE